MINKSNRALRRQMVELQNIVHARNLYSAAGRRMIAPEIIDGKLTVLDLYSEKRVEYVDGGFRDGNGQTISL